MHKLTAATVLRPNLRLVQCFLKLAVCALYNAKLKVSSFYLNSVFLGDCD